MPNKNVIYQYKWKGLRTKWDYIIEFIPADTTALNNPDIIELPNGILSSLTYSFKYDKYPLGFPEAPALNVEINLNNIPNDTVYDEFKNSLLNPASTTNLWIGFDFKNIELVIGTIVYLKIKPIGISNFYTIFTGIIRDINKLKYRIANKTVSLEITSFTKHILESFNFDSLDNYNEYEHLRGNQYIETPGIVEFAITNTTPTQHVEHYKTYHYFRMRTFSFIFQYLRIIGDEITKINKRDQSATISFTANAPIFNIFKQTYDKSGNKGNAIAEPYIIMKIYRYEESGNINIDGVGYRALRETYKNSVWDFLREYAEWMLSKSFVFNDICIFSYLLGNESFYINLGPEQIKDIEIELNSNRTKTVTASTYEHHSGNIYKDIEDYNAVKSGTLNEDEITIPMVFSNAPTAVEYNYFTNPGSQFKQTFAPHILGLYYSDNVPGLSGLTFMRVHEFCEYYITNEILSSSLPNCSFVPFNYNQLPFSKIEDLFSALQSTNCMHKWASQALLEVFSKINQSYIKIKVPIEEISIWEESPIWWAVSKIPWLIPLPNIDFLLTVIDNNLPPINKWSVLESSVDLKTEIAELKLLSILV